MWRRCLPLVPVGTKVRLINEPVKVAWVDGELCIESHPPVDDEGQSVEPDLKLLSKMLDHALGNSHAAINWDAQHAPTLIARQGHADTGGASPPSRSTAPALHRAHSVRSVRLADRRRRPACALASRADARSRRACAPLFVRRVRRRAAAQLLKNAQHRSAAREPKEMAVRVSRTASAAGAGDAAAARRRARRPRRAGARAADAATGRADSTPPSARLSGPCFSSPDALGELDALDARSAPGAPPPRLELRQATHGHLPRAARPRRAARGSPRGARGGRAGVRRPN